MTARRLACPLCSRSDRDRTLAVWPSGSVRCYRCGPDAWREIRDALRARGELPERDERPAPPPQPRSDGLAPWAQAIWRATVPLDGTDAERYLLARGCRLPPLDGDLRFHSRLEHRPTGYLGGALVALVTDILTGRPISLHRTWIRADGNKALGDDSRLYAAGHRLTGGCIRLWPDEAVTHGLGVAEGVETALSAAHAVTPVWSCMDAGHLERFPVPSGIESLTVFADRDESGRGEEAARAVAARWAAAGREVRIIMPPEVKQDFNDLWKGAA